MHCGLEQDYWDPCPCLIKVGREIRSKAGQKAVRRQRKSKPAKKQPIEPTENLQGGLFSG